MSYIVSTKKSDAGNGRTGSKDLSIIYNDYFIFIYDGNEYRLYDDIATRFCNLVDIEAYENGEHKVAVKIAENELKYYTHLLENARANYVVKNNKELAVHQYKEDKKSNHKKDNSIEHNEPPTVNTKETNEYYHNLLEQIQAGTPPITDGAVVTLANLNQTQTEKVLLAKDGINVECEISRTNGTKETIKKPIIRSDDVNIVTGDTDVYKALIGKRVMQKISVGDEEWLILNVSTD